MAKKVADDNLSPLADEFGKLKAQIAALNERADKIKTIFQQAGVTELEGDLFRITISDIADSVGPDWKTIAEKLKPSRQMLAANQKVTKKGYSRVNCNARTGVILGAKVLKK